jgi:hypothetical protein
MTPYSSAIREYVAQYRELHPTGLIDSHEIAAWAYERGLHKPNLAKVIDLIAADIAQVFREEYRTDPKGRSYRAKHAVTERVKGKTNTLWADIDDPNAPHGHFVKSFANRRRQIVGDCLQLRTDVDVYNDKNPAQVMIQIPLDFTNDVAELQLLDSPKAA